MAGVVPACVAGCDSTQPAVDASGVISLDAGTFARDVGVSLDAGTFARDAVISLDAGTFARDDAGSDAG